MDNLSLAQWLEQLAAKQPTPGGGAVAALFAATAAACVSMVSRYTTGEEWADRSQRMSDMASEADGLRQAALALMQADAAAFAKVGEAYKLPHKTADQKAARTVAVQAALAGAAVPPTGTITLSQKILLLVADLVDTGNPNVISDVAVAATSVRAALEAAAVNVAINAKLITNETVSTQLMQVIAQAEASYASCAQIVGAIQKGFISS